MRIVLIFSLLIFIGCSGKNEILLLPSDFKGHVVVFYSQGVERGNTIKESNDYVVNVPDDGIVFTRRDYKETESIIVRQNEIDKPVTGHSGFVFIPERVDYLVYYVGDSLDRENMKYLDHKELKSIYDKCINEK